MVKTYFFIGIMPLFLVACIAGTPAAPEDELPDTSGVQPTHEAPFIPEPVLAPAVTLTPSPSIIAEESPPRGAESEFTTDFSKHTVPYAEILSGGPPKDGIPAIDRPEFVRVDEADNWLKPQEPVLLARVGPQARAYPLQILIWHEIVNDEIDGVPLVITFCPLCNTGIAFERFVDGRVVDFGTTGRLRYSNLIMYDRQTETWWQQANGEAIVGELSGKSLQFYPIEMVSWQTFKESYPDGTVLSRETGFHRPYGENPYPGYDDVNASPFAYIGPQTPGILPAMARVLTVDLDGEAVAYPYSVLEKEIVVNDTAGGLAIVVFWVPGTASALDRATVAGGREVGSASAFSRTVGNRTLTFALQGDLVVDVETGSVWNSLGEAIQGPWTGDRLQPLVSVNHFWFSWAAFRPDTRIFTTSFSW